MNSVLSAIDSPVPPYVMIGSRQELAILAASCTAVVHPRFNI